MTERLSELTYCRDTVIMELGLIALVKGEVFEDCYDEKLEELRSITGEIIQIRGQDE